MSGMKLLGRVAASVIIAASSAAMSRAEAPTGPNIYDYAVPSTLHHLSAAAKPVYADQSELGKINRDFGDAYKLNNLEYEFDSPDKFTYRSRIGFATVTVTFTNSERVISASFVHQTTDISKDITKRDTLFYLGVLPDNYLETMRVQYVGQDTVNGIPTQVYMLRYITDTPNDYRRFEVWIDPVKHYVVQKRVWDGGNHQHETVVFKDPEQALPGFWLPTRAEAYAPDGKLAGTIEYTKISAS